MTEVISNVAAVALCLEEAASHCDAVSKDHMKAAKSLVKKKRSDEHAALIFGLARGWGDAAKYLRRSAVRIRTDIPGGDDTWHEDKDDNPTHA